tara:strand:- start:5980 stop:8853 length:2874 start_codon:yes stop_codon:yes gene_type:complete
MSMAIKSQAHVAAPKGGDINIAKQKALQAAKNLEEYLLIHYTMLRDYSGVGAADDRSQLSFDDIVHYHVYGDYRLLVSQVMGPHIDPGEFPFTPNDLTRADQDELAEYIQQIEEHYDTTETVMSPLVQIGARQSFRTLPIMRFKTTQYGAPLERQSIIPNENRENRLANRLRVESRYLDKLNGFFGFEAAASGPFVKQSRRRTQIEARMSHWANKQLHAGTQATRFFLPSLGTMLVSGDLTKLANYIGNRLDFIIDDIVDNIPQQRYDYLYQFQHREPNELQTEYQPISNINNIARDLDNEGIETAPRLFYEWAKHICAHPDYQMYLEQVATMTPDEQNIIDACGGQTIVSRNNNKEPDLRVAMPSVIFRIAKNATQRDNMFKAGEYFIKELLNAGRAAFGEGTAVKLKEAVRNRFQQQVDNLQVGPPDNQDEELLGLQEEFDPEETFYISKVERVGPADRYQVSRIYKGDYNGEAIFPLHPLLDGSPDENAVTWLERNEFTVYDEDSEVELDEEEMREKNLGGKIDNLHKVFMRIVMDVYMTFETYATLITNFVGYKKFSRFQGKNKEPNLRSPVGGGGGSGGSSKPIGEFLVEQRLEITLGQLATQYASMRTGTLNMEKFYSQDLLGAEVQWLSSSISQFSPTLTTAGPQLKGNVLVQEMYIPPAGLQEDQEYQLERVKPEVIFLKLDSALLRDIFIEYVTQQNAYVAETARQAGKKKKKNRKGQGGKNKNQSNKKILPTMWMLIKQQALSIASTENLKPHIMWNLLLDTVDKYRSELTMQYPLVPEHWATTFTVANLRKDPEVYGETVNEEEQRELLIDYMNFLETTYFNSFTFLGRLSAALDKIRINMISDIPTLQRYFVERLHQDSKAKILGRRYFPAYQTLLYIMRSFADIPANVRGEYSAMVFDEEAKEMMRQQMRGPRGSQSGEPIVAAITDISPRQIRPEQVVRRPGL